MQPIFKKVQSFEVVGLSGRFNVKNKPVTKNYYRAEGSAGKRKRRINSTRSAQALSLCPAPSAS